ncbi:MAG: 7-cyano-7-deazaguanine synthase QueC [Bdellovibrionaceae bacterium]|nr:7-cyano-7-deazaguanine synthase QueC [Pseudobdellovibrionaceae bacterium]
MAKCVVLLSSGLDSTVNFLLALKEHQVVAAITFNYGQKAAEQEISHSRALCDKHNVRHIVANLPFFKEFTTTSLVSQQMNVPGKKDIELSSSSHNIASAAKVWVPNRNGIFLNIAAGYAEGLGAKYVIPGFNLEEASTFPDNSQNFQDALKTAFTFSTQNHVEVLCFTQNMMKTEILALGLQQNLALKDLWPCYHGGEEWCMDCESCLRFSRAAHENGITL